MTLYRTPQLCNCLQNWIRNRRRPAAIKSAERMVEKISQGELVAPYVPPTSLISLGTSLHSAPPNPIMAFSQPHPHAAGHSHSSGLSSQQGIGPTDNKRFCLDQSKFCLVRTLSKFIALSPNQTKLHTQ